MTHDTNRAPEMLGLCIIGATLTWAAKLLEGASTAKPSIIKCPCGHPSCTAHLLSTQGSVGFEIGDAELYAAAPDLARALIATEARVAGLREAVKRRDALIDELCTSVDCAAEDIGGQRGALVIIRDLAAILKEIDNG